MARILLIVAFAVATFAALVPGASARSGNHGCNATEGWIYSSQEFTSGDNIVGGFRVDTPDFAEPFATIFARNESTDGIGTSSFSCGAAVGSWKLFQSDLGPGDDTLRLDANGMDVYGDPPPGPIPASIDAEVFGGGGDDRIRGHVGRDTFDGEGGDDTITLFKGNDKAFGGSGKDLIRAANGDRDKVRCGPGRDKAIVDPRDDVSGCETVEKKT